MYIGNTKVKEFINSVQRDPKLNEILYPYQTDEQAQELVQMYEPNVMFASKGKLFGKILRLNGSSCYSTWVFRT